MCVSASSSRIILNHPLLGMTCVALLLITGCGGEAVPEPYKDFQVIAESESGGTTLYLCEAHRVGGNLLLAFKYRNTGAEFHKNSVSCPRIPGDVDASFDPPMVKEGWVELRCRMDYPADAEKLGFIVRMCEERSQENADIVLTAEVPPSGEVVHPGLSKSVDGMIFSVEQIANIEGRLETNSDGRPSKAVIPYGEKRIILKEGTERILAVVYKADFKDSIPDIPREYTEWDQVLASTGRGVRLGGWRYTSDTGSARYYALVTVGSEPLPGEISASFFSAAKLVSFRREFVFSGLANPRE